MIAKRPTDASLESHRLERVPAPDAATSFAFRGMPVAHHAADPHGAEPQERFSVFWRVFGGTILSIAALAAVTIYNNLSNNVSELRSELNRVNHELRGELARTQEARAEWIRKDDFQNRTSNLWDAIKTLQGQGTTLQSQSTALKTEVEGLKDRHSKQNQDLDLFRKEVTTSLEGLRKDLSSLENLREKLQQLSIDVKLQRDEQQRYRLEWDRFQANEQERKMSRDSQQKQWEETLKEIQKAIQDCREKLARLEGQANPVPPGGSKPPTTTWQPR